MRGSDAPVSGCYPPSPLSCKYLPCCVIQNFLAAAITPSPPTTIPPFAHDCPHSSKERLHARHPPHSPTTGSRRAPLVSPFAVPHSASLAQTSPPHCALHKSPHTLASPPPRSPSSIAFFLSMHPPHRVLSHISYLTLSALCVSFFLPALFFSSCLWFLWAARCRISGDEQL